MDTAMSPFLGRLERLVEGDLGRRLLTFLVIPLLVIGAILLPPISALEWALGIGYTSIGWDGGSVVDPDGTQLSVPADGVVEPFRAKLTSIPRTSFLEGSAGKRYLQAAEVLPNQLIPKSPLYVMGLRGEAPDSLTFTVPIPNDAEPYETLDLYTWNEEAASWEWVPSMEIAEDTILEGRWTDLPSSIMVMQTNPGLVAVFADVPSGTSLPDAGRDALSGVHPEGLILGSDGTVEGNPESIAAATADAVHAVLPTIRNWEDGGAVRTDLANNLLIDSAQQEAHISAIESIVAGNLFSGIDLDYRGIDPELRAEYADFVTRLSERLHASGKLVSVRVEAPLQVAADRWETYGYDWRALGEAADIVYVPAIVDPRAYAPGGQMEALLDYAVAEIERGKIRLVLAARSVEKAGSYLLLKGYDESLAPLLGQIRSASPIAVPGETVDLSMLAEHQASELLFDPNLGTYSYQYIDNSGEARTVWLENASSLAQKIALAERYHLHGVSLQHLMAPVSDSQIWDLARRLQDGPASPSPSTYGFAWSVAEPGGQPFVSQERPVIDRSFSFDAPQTAGGELQVEAAVSDRGLVLGTPETIALAMATATPVNTPTPTITPTPTFTPTPEFTPTPRPTPTPETARIVVDGTYNVRSGPGTNYDRAGVVQAGQTLDIVAKNSDGSWWQVCCVEGEQVWIKANLVATEGPTGVIRVAANIPPTPTPAPQIAAPAAVAGACTFGYGIQAHMVHNDQAPKVMQMTTGMGFNWVKQQVEWSIFEPNKGQYEWGSLDGIVNAAGGSGVNVLFSVVNAPKWARPGGDYSVGGPPNNPQDFADFLGALAGKYCGSSVKALEVWNEQNLHYEWGNQEINPAAYIALLKPSYAAIKAACPSMIVVSGALTPAGSNPPFAIDDFAYLEGMLQNGLANYCDAVGVHPSGYNLGPDTRWEQGCEFITQQGSSFRGACDNPHHSWSFRSTMEGYWNYLAAHGATNRCLWPTEFGWAAGGAFDPRYGYADDNTLQEQAEWTVRAYQIMRDEWNFVGPAFLWNLNFRVVANGTEKAQWGIVDPGWGPLPAYNSLQAMPK